MSMAALSSSWTMSWATPLWGDSCNSHQWFEVTLSMACFFMGWRVCQVESKSQNQTQTIFGMVQDSSVSLSASSNACQRNSVLLRRVRRIANRELLKSTHQKLEEMNAMRTEPKHKNAKAYARWANKVWKEAQDAPTVLVPYKGKVWVARMSHNQLDFFFAEGDLFDLSLFDWHWQETHTWHLSYLPFLAAVPAFSSWFSYYHSVQAHVILIQLFFIYWTVQRFIFSNLVRFGAEAKDSMWGFVGCSWWPWKPSLPRHGDLMFRALVTGEKLQPNDFDIDSWIDVDNCTA